MPGTPEIVTRVPQPYAAVRARVPMAELGTLGSRLGEVFGWLAARGIAPAGPPFFRYNVIDMARELEVEAGVPTEAQAAGDDSVLTGILPAGRYVTMTYVGHPSELVNPTRDLLGWADEQGLQWDMSVAADGEHWGCRLESYLTDPSEEPDMHKWATELRFRLAG